MTQIKHRLYGLYFITVVFFMFVMMLISTDRLKERAENQKKMMLDDEVTILVEYIEGKNRGNEENLTTEKINQYLLDLSPVLQEQIIFMNIEGKLLYDSEMVTDKRNQLLPSSEIQEVLKEDVSSIANRESDDSGDMSYYAVKTVYNSQDQPVGIIKVSSGINGLKESIQYNLGIQMIGIIIFTLLIFLILNHWIHPITEAIFEMKQVVYLLGRTDYNARYSQDSYGELDQLGHSINELAINLQYQQLQLEISEKRISEMINHLVVGVILLDKNKQIKIMNPVANQLLATNIEGKTTSSYTYYIRNAQLIELVEKAYERQETVNSEITMYLLEEKILDVHVVPIRGRIQGQADYIILLYDITEIRYLEQVRTEFTANVSHELRTPITAIKGFSETLLDGAMHDEEVLTDFLEIMLKESARLDSMVENILKLSQLEQRELHVEKETVSIYDVIDEVLQILDQKIKAKNMTCSIKEKNKSLTIQANYDQLKQVCMNIIANAIMYTPEDGTISIEIKRVGGEAQIQVIDNGIGILEKNQHRIFERFFRVDQARSRNSGGTGLGLSIVKWLVDSMNGRLDLYSEVNVGTTFVIWLPIK